MAVEQSMQNLINSLQIASPCPMLWGDMQCTEEEAIRFCGECRKNVYDVSKMSTKDAVLLLQRAEINGSSTCMQLYRRVDGTVITDDCPVGLRRIRDSWRKVHSAVATFILFMIAQTSFAQVKSGDSVDQKRPTRGRVAVPSITGGMIRTRPVLGGAPVAPNWRNVAMQNESIKKLADKVAEKQRQSSSSDSDKLEILKMRLAIAEEANKQGVPYFALQELGEVQSALQGMQDDTSSKNLLKQVLDAKMFTSKKLGVKDTQCIQDELDKLK